MTLKSLSLLKKTLFLNSLAKVDPTQRLQKESFLNWLRVTLGSSNKISVASHDLKFAFATFLMIIFISQSKRGGRTTLRTDSMVASASKWWFFQVYTQFSTQRPQKESFTKWLQWLQGPVKNFLRLFMTCNLCLEACLWSYLSPKANGVVVRHLHQFLRAGTQANGDFWKIILKY